MVRVVLCSCRACESLVENVEGSGVGVWSMVAIIRDVFESVAVG